MRFEIPLRLYGIFCNRERYLKYSTTIPVVSVDFPFMQLNNLLRQIVDSDEYRSDYEQITSALLFEDVSYSTAITALQHIIDSRVFQ